MLPIVPITKRNVVNVTTALRIRSNLAELIPFGQSDDGGMS